MPSTIDQQACIYHVVKARAEQAPNALAILAPGRTSLSYGRLRLHIDAVVQTLRTMGIGRHVRVALVLPNGPEMAVAFLAVAASATCVPLNPAYGHTEVQHYLTALNVDVLITLTGMDSPARAVAKTRGIPIVELSPRPEAEAGVFTLTGEAQPYRVPDGLAQPGDVALVLHTSGTTSRPRIVPLTQANVCASASYTCDAVALDESDRCLNILPLFHAAGLVTTTLASLMAGGSIVCTPGFSASAFFAWMAEFRPTWYPAVPTIHRAILEQASVHHETIAHCPLRFIRSSTAPLPAQVLIDLERVFRAPVIEGYGMTEACLITCNPLPTRQRKAGSVGVAAGPEVAIMNEDGVFLPTGERGEIVVRGANVVQGYEHDPLANQHVFTQGWLKTGDIGFFDADGYLFLSGRLKEIINRGGEKIAPQEVERVLVDHPAVAQAVTFAVPHARLGEDIAVAVTLRPHTAATASDIRQFVATRLAAFKVPQQVLIVDDIPKGPTGKVQRRNLAVALGLLGSGVSSTARPTDPVAPRSPVEALLVDLWTQLLGLKRVGIHDNFFVLGGDSLLATQLISRVRAVMQVEVSLPSFFQTPTVAAMAGQIESVPRGMSALLTPSITPAPKHGPLPLSYAQQRLWFLEQLGLSGHAYTLLEVVRLHGRLHVAAFEQSLQDIIGRHAILRTTFADAEGQPYQHVAPSIPVPLPVVDCQALSVEEREDQIQALARTEIRRPFVLAEGPLLRAVLLRLTADEHVLLLTMHHIVSDGWSHRVFWRELAVLYRALVTGEPSPLPELPMQYADFAQWQLQWLQGEVLDTLLAYWRQQLAGVSTLRLPTDHPRPSVLTSRGARHPVKYPLPLTQGLKVLSQQYGVTLFMTLLAAFQTLLHRYTGQDDIAVGTLLANRNRLEIEGLIGFFVNTVVLRTNLSGNPRFSELLERVREVTLGAFSHQDLPFEKLLETLRPSRELNRNPLFQVLFVLHNTPRQTLELPDLEVTFHEIDPETAKFDLTLNLGETQEGLQGWFEYSTDLFETATIARLAGHFQTLLEGIVAAPGQRLAMLPLLTAGEHHQVRVAWNSTSMDFPLNQCLHQVFEAQVARTPGAVALIWGDTHLTYHELNRRANQVAHYLRTLGVGPEALVGLCIERSLAMVVGLLGILKAGAAYVPLDPTYPSERLAFMLEDAQPAVVLTQERLVAGLPVQGAQTVCLDAHWPTIARYSASNPVSRATADHVAYLLYTSGSTGKPKGVLGIHRATLNALAWMWQAYPFAGYEVCCQKTSISFGDSIQELLGPLLQGRPIVLIPDAVLKELPRFVQTLAVHRVTRLILVPSLLRALLDTFSDLQDRLPSLELWFAGGEALSSALVQRFRKCLPQGRLINLYGASEASDDTTWYDTSVAPCDLSSVPIGCPIANTQVYVLDQHLQPLPIGVPGELYVGGAGLTRGYLNRPKLTAERFIPHPFSHEPGARLYKTGDVVRYRPDGNLEYLYRLDHQVKLRGIRIELGEIEAVLAQHPAVLEAVVIAHKDTPEEPRLIAYVVLAQKPGPTVRELRRFLAMKLPSGLVPATFVILETLPLTPSGKVNRQALPVPGPVRPDLEDLYVAPRTAIERQVTAIWCHLLALERIGIHDNFFELGGHSLLAMQLLSRVRDATHVEVSLLSFFETPTVAGLASIIATVGQTDRGLQAPDILPLRRENALPASIAQEHFWGFDQALPGLPLFNLPYVMRLEGALDVAVLEQSFNEIIRRHEALRTTFATVDGQLVQVIAPTLHITLTVRDLRALPETAREGEARRLGQEESQHPFDLSRGPLLRGCLLWLDEQEYILLTTLHHIISDGWSLGVLGHELTVLYNAFATGAPLSLPELPMQYADFAFWQRQWRHNAMLEAQLVYWTAQLHEPLPVLRLPTDRPRGTALQLYTARQSLDFPRALFGALKDLGQREGCTLFMICLAAFKMLLYGYTGQEDLCVATLVANRTRRETEGMLGLFANTVILRTALGGNPTGREVLQRVRATTLTAYAHQDLPFEELVRTLERERNLQRSSLCQVMVIWQNSMQRPQQCSAQTVSFEAIEQSVVVPHVALTTFDIILILRERSQGLSGTCIYKADLFDVATISRMLDDFRYVLTCLSTGPDQALATFRTLSLQDAHD
jgi:amino acid adenylation domain-containing protein